VDGHETPASGETLATILCPSGVGLAGPIEGVAYAAATEVPWRCWCSREHSAWDVLQRMLAQGSDLWHPIALGGGGQTIAQIIVRRDEVVRLDFAALGVPPGSRALRVVTTPFRHPVDLYEVSRTIGRRDDLPEVMYLRPVAFAADEGEP
jgi:hypothetical protein